MNREIQELREVIEKLVPLLSGRNLQVTQRGTQAYVRANPRTNQPEVVNIPSIPDNASPDFIGAVSGFIDHEVGHVLHTDWKYYGGDGIKLNKFSPEGQALTRMHNIIEDTYVEREQVKIFPGSASNLDRLHKHFLEKITTPAIASAKGNQNIEFSYLIVPMMRALSGQEIFQEFMDKGGYWKHPMIENLHLAMSEEALELIKTARNTKETLEVAQEIHDILFRQQQEEERKKREEEEKQKQQQKAGKSQDKPEKKAGEGEGTGERDHSEQEPGEEGSAGAESEEAGGATGGEPDETGSGSEPDEDADEADETSAGDGAADPEGAQESAPEPEDETEGGAGSGADESAPEAPESESDEGEAEEAGTGEPDDAEGEEPEAGAGEPDEADEEKEGEGEASGSADDEDEESEEETGAGAPGSEEPEDEDDGEEMGEDGAPDEEEDYEDNAGDETGGNDSESQGGGNGYGGEAGKSMFDLDPDDFAPLDLGSAMAKQIEEMATKAIKDSSYSAFTKDEDRIEVFEVDDKQMDAGWVPEMDDTVSGMVGPMQKEIERLMAAQALSVRTSGHRSGRLHSASLYRVLQGDPRVFQRKEEHRTKDTAVMLLCDNSGSMHGDKLRVAMQSAYALAQTLERVNIPNEIVGFTTGSLSHDALRQLAEESVKGVFFHRTSSIIMPIYKKFEERVTPAVKRRIAFQVNKQVGLYNNTDGESLEYAAWRLIPRREKRKVMLVLSDGQPVGSGSGPHLADTVKRLTKMGIETVGIGIQSNAVERFYPRSMVLNRVEDLPAAVMGELRRILTN